MCFIALYSVMIYLCLYPDSWSQNLFTLVNIPQDYRYMLFLYSMLHLLVAWLFERFVIVGPGRHIINAIRLRKKATLFDKIKDDYDTEMALQSGVQIVIKK